MAEAWGDVLGTWQPGRTLPEMGIGQGVVYNNLEGNKWALKKSTSLCGHYVIESINSAEVRGSKPKGDNMVLKPS